MDRDAWGGASVGLWSGGGMAMDRGQWRLVSISQT